MMRRFARWHIWLGWIAALPILLWLVSGLFMAARPIEEVRAEDLRRPARAVDPAGLIAPKTSVSITKLALLDEAGRAVWVVSGADKSVHRFDARSGAMLGPVDEAEARRIATATYAGRDELQSMRSFAAHEPPLDLRRPRPSWQATFAGDTHLYIDAETGEVLALRTRWWRAYDFLWGLHIMDPGERENAHNPWVWTLGGLSLVTALMGAVLLFRRRRRAR
ncbi:PepSY domain-containing protein [Novosphingobium sp. MW5]|nr:PepSY domain-containing protein [Novosphingobium sp. MW5]